MEKRAPFVRPNSGISGEHYIQRSDDHHYLRKRTFKSVGTPRSLSFNPSGGVGGESSGDLRKRRGLSPNSATRTVKRAGGYNPSDPQGGYGEYGSGGGYRKRRDPSLSSITKTVKRDGG
ncbi:hypothetical protein BGX30_005117 [Mortierella sp. GBA39]|nr:hypothetical protein BGX30_005117 [Mortierella sp. GBA39]